MGLRACTSLFPGPTYRVTEGMCIMRVPSIPHVSLQSRTVEGPLRMAPLSSRQPRLTLTLLVLLLGLPMWVPTGKDCSPTATVWTGAELEGSSLGLGDERRSVRRAWKLMRSESITAL